MRRAVACAFTALVICTGCGNSSVNGFTVPSVSEMATTAVSGAFNASGGSAVGVRFSPPRTTATSRSCRFPRSRSSSAA